VATIAGKQEERIVVMMILQLQGFASPSAGACLSDGWLQGKFFLTRGSTGQRLAFPALSH
jgi:hypothetical protein